MDITGIGSVADLIHGIADKIWPDPVQRAQAQAALDAAKNAGALKQVDNDFQLAIEQIKTNAVDAAQPGMHFRNGAGWTCVAAFVVMTVKPVVEWILVLTGNHTQLPAIDSTFAMTMLSGLLGLGAYHTYEKVKVS